MADPAQIRIIEFGDEYRRWATGLLEEKWGSAQVKERAADAGCRRIWLITSNDNVAALRFYQKKGIQVRRYLYKCPGRITKAETRAYAHRPGWNSTEG